MTRRRIPEESELKIHKRNSVTYKMRQMPLGGSVLVSPDQLNHDRRRDVIRMYARQLGFGVTITDLPDGGALITRINPPKPEPIKKAKVEAKAPYAKKAAKKAGVEMVTFDAVPKPLKCNAKEAAMEYANATYRVCLYDNEDDLSTDLEARYNAFLAGYKKAVGMLKQFAEMLD